MLTHEDDGMMGQFLVSCPTSSIDTKQSIENSVKLYPIPSQDRLSIKSDNKIQTIKIYDLRGKCISIYSDINSNYTELKLTSFNNGIYIVELLINDNIIRKKVNILN